MPWRVIGGADKGGIVVRSGHDLSSPQVKDRLAHGAVIDEVSRIGERLCYKLISGSGPQEGWVSIKLKEKPLLTEELSDSSATQSLLDSCVYIDVPSARKDESSIEVLEKLVEFQALMLAEDRAKFAEDLKALSLELHRVSKETISFDSCLEDLVHLARDRHKRDRIIKFLGSLLARLVKSDLTRAVISISWKLCVISFASSMQDIIWIPAIRECDYAVLLFGFGGSHMNDLRPAVEMWSCRHGADVLAFGPSLRERQQMLEAILEKTLQILQTCRHLVVHMCSDGGFAMLRAFLKLWTNTVEAGTTNITPEQALVCIVSDCAGLGSGNDFIIKDGTVVVGGKKGVDLNKSAQAFFAGAGINMFIHAGACKTYVEEPADSFGRSMGILVENNVFKKEAPELIDVLWPDIEHILVDVPILVITSKADKVVISERCFFLAECFRQISDRKHRLDQRWHGANEEILGNDGSAVHTYVFEKASHCRAFMSNADEYWDVVDRFVIPCVSMQS